MATGRDEAAQPAGGGAGRIPFPARMGRPANGALAAAGYTHLAELTTVTAREILALHGMGPRGIAILRETLAEHGLAFAGE